ncbi:hypothetical protein B0J11DRAFT_42377 [Dendryphion nanum]|uniref:Uncharacterized protein n=1 Tax=Dendryphion nanum TaxID=256645 RepID=A0A9P9J119_9PLEO|nr:hypothetical protein B0J11DRAFT_42377 [Dendryphion nanum]
MQSPVNTRGLATVPPSWRAWPHDTTLPAFSELDIDINSLAQPELVDQALIEWGLKQSNASDKSSTTIDVLHGKGLDARWAYGVDEYELSTIIQAYAENDTVNTIGASEEYFHAYFINTRDGGSGWLPGNFSVRPKIINLLRAAGLSDVLLCAIWNKWAKMGENCFTRRDDQGFLQSFEYIYQNLSGWDGGVGFYQFTRTRLGRTYFCFNYPPRALERLRAYVERKPSLLYRDFFLDALSAQETSQSWQRMINERRLILVDYERRQDRMDNDFDNATRELHTLASSWHIFRQDCEELLGTLDFLLKTHEKYLDTLQGQNPAWEISKTRDSGDSLQAIRNQIYKDSCWAAVYSERTNIRINLLFHLVNHSESLTNTQIASATAKVAEQTQQDSSSMITIAAVTMFFLPGTFVCAILSTTFFDYDDSGVKVGKNWYILPAVTVPLTFTVFAIWLGWQYIRRKWGSQSGHKRDLGTMRKRRLSSIEFDRRSLSPHTLTSSM